jgi:hypothetical protein
MASPPETENTAGASPVDPGEPSALSPATEGQVPRHVAQRAAAVAPSMPAAPSNPLPLAADTVAHPVPAPMPSSPTPPPSGPVASPAPDTESAVSRAMADRVESPTTQTSRLHPDALAEARSAATLPTLPTSPDAPIRDPQDASTSSALDRATVHLSAMAVPHEPAANAVTTGNEQALPPSPRAHVAPNAGRPGLPPQAPADGILSRPLIQGPVTGAHPAPATAPTRAEEQGEAHRLTNAPHGSSAALPPAAPPIADNPDSLSTPDSRPVDEASTLRAQTAKAAASGPLDEHTGRKAPAQAAAANGMATDPAPHRPSAHDLPAPDGPLHLDATEVPSRHLTTRPASDTPASHDTPSANDIPTEAHPSAPAASPAGQPATPAPRDPLALLLHAAPPGSADTASFLQYLEQGLLQPSPTERQALARALESPQAAQRLLEAIPLRQLDRVLEWLRPTEHAAVVKNAALVHSACRQVGTPLAGDTFERQHARFILRELFEEGRAFEPVGAGVRLARHLAEALRPPEPQRWMAGVAAALGRHAVAALPPTWGLEPGAAVLSKALAAVAAGLPQGAANPHATAASGEEAWAIAPGDTLYIANAGMVLAGAYVQRLFGMLGLASNEAFASPQAAERGVHLLQYLVTGSTDTPEPELVLNKILCGLPLETPVLRGIELTEPERTAVDGLLQAMIAHWKIIGKTSVAGLRESFLQREGRLSFDAQEGWQLQVEPRSFDMLIDHLPWGYSLQKFQWMEMPLHVEWR